MEFTLKYRGGLPSAQGGNSKDAKQRIRRAFHPQLENCWKRTPDLNKFYQSQEVGGERRWLIVNKGGPGWSGTWAGIPVSEFTFIPLVITGYYLKLVCELDIRLFWRDVPGMILNKGDLDNRIKVLFDALSVPQLNQLPNGDRPNANENPFFCLLEDDKLITRVSIMTGALNTHSSHDEPSGYVELDIDVTVKASELSNWPFR
jgi:hypothetical protein